ncbi:zinc ABC transporter substrate-binding protein [Cerasibacillus terrae]|uniref:Zinc ABC transporter substrate-binding protein n=1 Tax=Cerasibacillus terrae TaxID=2498845 RepID=A0A5C8NUV6_9BACI|nr:zinc ABC transporter substrate-binding protein [Cerasibacillus terrae]TXL64958.1 zinc ABC transporter substrate-binding protein [Cerasibacillus terrae]
MKRFLYVTFILIAATVLLAACGGDKKETEKDTGSNNEEDSKDALQVVTSFTTIEDMVHQIAGDQVDVYNLVPTGTDPHEYEPLPEDIKHATDADILFMNGMNLEGGEDGWFYKMVDSVNQDHDKVFELNEGVEPKYIGGEDGIEEEVNPHSFLDPQVGITMATNLRDALIEVDPDNKDVYEENAAEYLERLEDLDTEYEDKIGEIPEEDRILVTSERAFQYMTEHYGLREAYVWEVDTEELGTPEQIKTLVDTLKEEQPPVLFLESNVDSRPLETVSSESGIDIYEEHIYSDEIGKKGDKVDTYVKLLQHNIDIIYDGLKGE